MFIEKDRERERWGFYGWEINRILRKNKKHQQNFMHAQKKLKNLQAKII